VLPTPDPLTVEALRKISQDCTLLHIAAHGSYNERDPYFSGVLIAEENTETGQLVQYALPDGTAAKVPSFGAARMLTAGECMSRFELRSCRLVVLSSCDSGVPSTHAGGEFTGLPTAFLLAGAKSVIASLWPVYDTAASLLMKYFYQMWGSLVEPSVALAAARLALGRATRDEIRGTYGREVRLPPGDQPFDHPFFTDAFHCFGSW
jgi:CHAT domain-containing protein